MNIADCSLNCSARQMPIDVAAVARRPVSGQGRWKGPAGTENAAEVEPSEGPNPLRRGQAALHGSQATAVAPSGRGAWRLGQLITPSAPSGRGAGSGTGNLAATRERKSGGGGGELLTSSRPKTDRNAAAPPFFLRTTWDPSRRSGTPASASVRSGCARLKITCWPPLPEKNQQGIYHRISDLWVILR